MKTQKPFSIVSYLCCFILIAVVTLGCSEVEQSSGKVLDNANSVIRSGSGKIWINEKESGRAQYQDNTGKHYDPHRGYVDEDEPAASDDFAAPSTAIGDDRY